MLLSVHVSVAFSQPYEFDAGSPRSYLTFLCGVPFSSAVACSLLCNKFSLNLESGSCLCGIWSRPFFSLHTMLDSNSVFIVLALAQAASLITAVDHLGVGSNSRSD